jgi:hypothetical protein
VLPPVGEQAEVHDGGAAVEDRGSAGRAG